MLNNIVDNFKTVCNGAVCTLENQADEARERGKLQAAQKEESEQ